MYGQGENLKKKKKTYRVYISEKSLLAIVTLDGRFLGVSILLLIFPICNHLWNT